MDYRLSAVGSWILDSDGDCDENTPGDSTVQHITLQYKEW